MTRLLLASVLAFGGIATARAGVDIHVNFGGGPYYGYAPRDVVYVERYVPAPYVPRVLVLSRHARVPLSVMVGHYRSGWGWDRICNHYRVPTRVIYSPMYGGPPYGRAYGRYKHGRGGGWRDDDRDDRDYDRRGKRYRNGYRR